LKDDRQADRREAYSLYLHGPGIAAFPWCCVGSGGSARTETLPIPCLPRPRHTNQPRAPPTRGELIEAVEQVYHFARRRNKLRGASWRGARPRSTGWCPRGLGLTPPFRDQNTRPSPISGRLHAGSSLETAIGVGNAGLSQQRGAWRAGCAWRGRRETCSNRRRYCMHGRCWDFGAWPGIGVFGFWFNHRLGPGAGKKHNKLFSVHRSIPLVVQSRWWRREGVSLFHHTRQPRIIDARHHHFRCPVDIPMTECAIRHCLPRITTMDLSTRRAPLHALRPDPDAVSF